MCITAMIIAEQELFSFVVVYHLAFSRALQGPHYNVTHPMNVLCYITKIPVGLGVCQVVRGSKIKLKRDKLVPWPFRAL